MLAWVHRSLSPFLPNSSVPGKAHGDTPPAIDPHKKIAQNSAARIQHVEIVKDEVINSRRVPASQALAAPQPRHARTSSFSDSVFSLSSCCSSGYSAIDVIYEETGPSTSVPADYFPSRARVHRSRTSSATDSLRSLTSNASSSYSNSASMPAPFLLRTEHSRASSVRDALATIDNAGKSLDDLLLSFEEQHPVVQYGYVMTSLSEVASIHDRSIHHAHTVLLEDAIDDEDDDTDSRKLAGMELILQQANRIDEIALKCLVSDDGPQLSFYPPDLQPLPDVPGTIKLAVGSQQQQSENRYYSFPTSNNLFDKWAYAPASRQRFVTACLLAAKKSLQSVMRLQSVHGEMRTALSARQLRSEDRKAILQQELFTTVAVREKTLFEQWQHDQDPEQTSSSRLGYPIDTDRLRYARKNDATPERAANVVTLATYWNHQVDEWSNAAAKQTKQARPPKTPATRPRMRARGYTELGQPPRLQLSDSVPRRRTRTE